MEVEKVAVEVGLRHVEKWEGLRRLATPQSHKQAVKRSLGPRPLTNQILRRVERCVFAFSSIHVL